jgi:hypothetical protein
MIHPVNEYPEQQTDFTDKKLKQLFNDKAI